MAVGFAPATRVPIIGDDFYVLFQAQGASDGDFWNWVSLTWGWGMQAGHFNPVGQVLGGTYHFFAFPISSALNIAPHYYYEVGAFVLLVLAVLSATFFFQTARRTLDPGYPKNTNTRTFAAIALATGLSLQIHPWSNDPVTTYSMAGYGACAVGFVLLAFAMQAIRPETKPAYAYLTVGITAVFSVVYYELLVAAIAAIGFIFASMLIVRKGPNPVPVARTLTLLAVGVVMPAIIFITGRLYVTLVSGTGGYTGTSVAIGIDGIRTLLYSLISSVPGGAWAYSLYRVNPMVMSRAAFVSATILTLLLILFATFWWKTRVPFEPKRPRMIWLPLVAILIFWVLSSAAQAFTEKYILEISAPGLVYLFYPIGLLTISLILVACLTFIPNAKLLSNGAIVLSLVIWFSVNQQIINWTLGNQMHDVYVLNTELGAAATNDRILDSKRCETIQKWANLPWPEYYRNGILENLDKSYAQFKIRDFCSVPGVPFLENK